MQANFTESEHPLLFQNLPQIAPNLSQINTAHALPIRAIRIHSNIVLPSMSRSSKWLLPSAPTPPNFIYSSPLSHTSLNQTEIHQASGSNWQQFRWCLCSSSSEILLWGNTKQFMKFFFHMIFNALFINNSTIPCYLFWVLHSLLI